MKKLLLYLKNNDFKVPINIGKSLSKIPFKYRPGVGTDYRRQREAISKYDELSVKKQQTYIYKHFFKVFKHAYLNVPFYYELYKESGIEPRDIKSFSDISNIPIITKDDLLNVPLEERSFPIKNRTLVNTGGSSGKPLSFYMDSRRFGNEWAHIHHIWARLGYSPDKLKLQFDGRSQVKDYIQYDFVRNSLRYDIYAKPELTSSKLLNFIKKHKISYLHGYPSAIYNFALFCRDHNSELLRSLQNTLQGAFLVSEYPNPYFRQLIEETFNIPTQSFYGHTETCVMAYEKEEAFRFSALQTYGYAEAVERLPNRTNLVGTSYYNYASPLIRYDTEDGIESINKEGGILKNFKIGEGRKGEYILDKHHQRIPLTGLIFGRHHKIFGLCKHIQIKQEMAGKATVLYVSDKVDQMSIDNKHLFDSASVNIDFKFKKIDQPILSKSGKINLLVRQM